ncbi:BTAD domain-containing putative transcriptional regulator [Streptomyces sp. NPDC020875]|uniref:BTAD domain-containing putative transcriptional regulator n=1 Tax=Streptomyces sp. NPDC020875 TaxID=3154898 RepID=UPI00340CB3B6
MWFRVLGPLEVVKEDHIIPLGGTKQRATLGYLLLNANRVVSSRELLGALWPDGALPATARKILQNAVWGLRGALAADRADRQAGVLLTKAPGYVLRIDPDQVDLHLFHRGLRDGRALLESGASAEAADTLRSALALWQGQVLADLVESGINWPELAAAASARLDAMEDYFEAELRCGRHQSMLGALEATVEAEPLRERLCGQLMLALYRCGRQADALNVYSRVRASLIEDLGLEPQRELQALQQAILHQDSELSPVATGSPAVAAPAPVRVQVAAAPAAVRTAPGAGGEPVRTGSPRPVAPAPAAEAAPRAGEAVRDPDGPEGRLPASRRPVSVLLLDARLSSRPDRSRPEGADELRDTVTGRIRELVHGFGGSVICSIGSTRLAVFGPEGGGDGYAERAVRAALAIRGEFHAPDGVIPLSRSIRRGCEVTISAAVATGQALLRYEDRCPEALASADGSLLDECQSLLSLAAPGDIRVCDATWRMTVPALSYVQAGDAPRVWKLTRTPRRDERAQRPRVVDREIELDVLRGMLERVRQSGTPHVVTVFGEAGTGKSRLLEEFERRAMGQPSAMRFVVPGGLGGDGETCCDSHLFHSRMSPLLDPHGAESRKMDLGQLARSTRTPLVGLEPHCPLVVMVDDLHEADDAVLDFIGAVGQETAEGAVFIVATAHPKFLERRPGWGGGVPRFTTLSIGPAGAAARPLPSPSRADLVGRSFPGYADCTP